jgi:hypothetical protein
VSGPPAARVSIGLEEIRRRMSLDLNGVHEGLDRGRDVEAGRLEPTQVVDDGLTRPGFHGLNGPPGPGMK